MIKYLGFLILVVLVIIGSLRIGKTQEIVQPSKPVAKMSQFSLRNDGENLMKPIGSPVSLLPKTREEVEEEVHHKVSQEEPAKEEKRIGLKFAESEEEFLKIAPKPFLQPEIEPIVPEKSRYFAQLSPGEKLLPPALPPEIKKVKKPKVTTPAPLKEEKEIIVAKVAEKPKVIPTLPLKEEKEIIPAKTEEVKEIIPPKPEPSKEASKEEILQKEPKFAFQGLNPVLKWGIIISGIISLILVLVLRYLWRKRELSSLIEIDEEQGEKIPRYKSLVEDIKALQAGYKGLEKMIENVEKKLSPITALKGVSIDEFTRDTSKEVIRPVEAGIKEIQATCQEIEKMMGEFDKRLAPLDALKGLSIKELAHQTSMEFYRPLESELRKMQISSERMMSEFEEKIDKKIEAINKKSKMLEKTISEIDSRLITIDAIISSLHKGEGNVSKPLIKTEEIKPVTAKDKKSREILHNQIYKLSDEGLSIDEIAQQTKLGKGEVRLILGLRKK